MSFGVMGGDIQPQGHVQTVVRMLDYDQQPQAACCAPRWKLNRDFTLDVESSMRAQTIEGLKGLGHTLKAIDDWVSAQASDIPCSFPRHQMESALKLARGE